MASKQDELEKLLRSTEGKPYSEAVQILLDWHEKDTNKQIAAYDEIFKWLLGESGDFPRSEPGKRYGFRTELRARLANLRKDK